MLKLLKGNKAYSSNAPETIIVFTTYKREKVSVRSLKSLVKAVEPYRKRIKIIVADATDDFSKLRQLRECEPDDIIWTPSFTPAASSRNLAVTFAMDKYSSQFICLVEDDFEYTEEWYPRIVETTVKNYGIISPWGLAYGIFSASPYRLKSDWIKKDKENGLIAYIFGAAADQRFMPFHHYLSVFRMWDPDVMGISFSQTGMQTARNTMRGYCGGIITNRKLCWPITGSESTWSGGKRDAGPPAHDFDVKKYQTICKISKINSYKSEDY